jgi:hypothetical protein
MECNQGGELIWAKRKGKLRRGVNLRLNCAFEVRIEEGRCGRWEGTAGGGVCFGNRGDGGWLEVGEGADMWAPPVGDHMREREWRWAGAAELGQKRELGRGLGRWVGFGFVFFFSFFKSISNQFQTLLNSNLLHNFSQLFHKYF